MPYVLCAPDSFKETISAAGAAEAMAAGIESLGSSFTADRCPIADGGEGTLEALIKAMGGEIRSATVTGPLGDPVAGQYGVVSDRRLGVVELAQASGLAIVPEDRRDPTQTTTYGTGELIARAVSDGCEEVIVCIGGSATCDGATGIAQALGVTFYDQNNRPIARPMTGGRLADVQRIEPPDTMPRLRICCDVTNPLCGERGAAAVYGPQKGATLKQVRQLDSALAQLAKIVNDTASGFVPVDPDTPGSGSAGGCGWGLMAFCRGELRRGIELVLDAVNFDERCRRADLVLTGEGQLDRQTAHGKATLGIAQRAARIGKPTIAIVGRLGDGYELVMKPALPHGFDAAHALADRFSIDRAMNDTAACLQELTGQIVQ